MNNVADFVLAVLAIAAILVCFSILRFWIKQGKDDPTVWERAIRRFEKSDRFGGLAQGIILFVGSSSIRFWKSLAADMAPLTVLNRGFGGSQIHDVTHYVRRIVTPYKPRAIVFYAGENDMAGVLFSPQKTPEEIQLAFGIFCRTVHADLPDVPIYFIAIKPPKTRRKHWPAMQVANQLVREYCATDLQLHFIDVVPAMLDRAGKPRLDVFIWDGLHLNQKGYAIWTAVVKPILRKAFP